MRFSADRHAPRTAISEPQADLKSLLRPTLREALGGVVQNKGAASICVWRRPSSGCAIGPAWLWDVSSA
eukprot:14187836-Alexandrium_andersonii.AAC.1